MDLGAAVRNRAQSQSYARITCWETLFMSSGGIGLELHCPRPETKPGAQSPRVSVCLCPPAPDWEALLSMTYSSPRSRLCLNLDHFPTFPQTCPLFFISLPFAHAVLPAWNTDFCPCPLCGLFIHHSQDLISVSISGSPAFPRSPARKSLPPLSSGGLDSDLLYCPRAFIICH